MAASSVRHVLPMTNVRGLPSAAEQPSPQPGADLRDGDPLLGHRVALTDRHGVIVEGVEVHGEAVRGSDLVLTAVPAPDRPRVVELDIPRPAQLGGEVPSLRGEVGICLLYTSPRTVRTRASRAAAA